MLPRRVSPGAPADVAECQQRVLSVEGADHRQAAFERLDEVVAALLGHGVRLSLLRARYER